MNKCMVLFVEGDTEVEFYKRVIANARKLCPANRFDIRIEYRNVKGIGGFKNNVLRKFIKEIKPKYGEECIYIVVLCSDTDVFDILSKPPIKWKEVERELCKNGASKIIHVRAKHSIEDWFLYDAESIIGFLRLPKNTKITGKSGYDKLQNLFRQANKVYFKGAKCNGMITKLNIDKIVNSVGDQLKPLYDVLGVKINKIT